MVLPFCCLQGAFVRFFFKFFLHHLLDFIPLDFIGRYYFMDPIREIAAYSGMSEAKVKSGLHRARLGLKQYLEQEGFLDESGDDQ